ncbi:MAG: FtsK/SpoIIIE domain-containing protein [Microbacteriaceae bacterium]
MTSDAGAERVAAPRPPVPPPRHPLPLLQCLAPVAASLALWALTRSPFSLVFAVLGPLVALGSLLDARLAARGHARQERRRFAAELERAGARVRELHERERAVLEGALPSAAERVERIGRDPESWCRTSADAVLVLGRARTESRVRLEDDGALHAEDERLVRLRAEAGMLEEAPIATGGDVAVVGPLALARPIARGLVLQLAAQLSPAQASVVVAEPPPAGHWLARLPQPIVVEPADGPAAELVRLRDAHGERAVAVVAAGAQAPAGCRCVLDVSARPRVVRHEDGRRLGPVRVEAVSAAAALAAAELLARAARDRPGVLGAARPPESVAFAELPAPAAERAGPAAPMGLAAPIGLGPGGAPTVVDLVRDGPHAVVGGTTGSGKSELLVSWVLALAERHPPERLTFLLVDFKGGSAFAPLVRLPHCVGVISDLGPAEALRALASLRAELRRREAELARHAVRTVEELSAGVLARLVVVVDEFAVIVAEHPELHALFADLAARGRSLGIHLVLCTQRPAGTVRDGVLANVDLRLCLRVNNRQDSLALIGTDAAALLPPRPAGRALLSIAGREPVAVQVALATPEDAEAVLRGAPAARPHRPWLDPLPARIALTALPALTADRLGAVRLGLGDLPEEQAQPLRCWRPGLDGHLLAVGAGRSGRSGLLALVASQVARPIVIAPEAEAAWDAVTELAHRAEARGGGSGRESGRENGGGSGAETVVLLDDLDALLARMPEEHRAAFAEALGALLRSGAAAGLALALTTQRTTGAAAALAALCDVRITLRMPSRQEHLLAGAPAEAYDAAAPPGRGILDGTPLQLALSPAALPAPWHPPSVGVALEGPLAVVAAAPESVVEAIDPGRLVGARAADARERAEGGAVVLGDPADWQAAWGLLPALAARMPVLFLGCSVPDIRALARSAQLPPPGAAAGAVLLGPGGRMRRAHLVTTTDSAAGEPCSR